MNNKKEKKKEYPLISIITCVYNGEKYISRLLESVLNMGYPNIEHIIVNDGSTDSTEKIVFEFAQKYKCKSNASLSIKYVRQQNMGLGAATNAGLAAISGQYWTWINCDDWYVPKAFNKLLRVMSLKKCDLLLFNYKKYLLKDNQILDLDSCCFYDYQKHFLNTDKKIKKFFLFDELKYCHFLCKTSSFRKISTVFKIPDFKYTQDVQLTSQLFPFLKTAYCNEPLSCFLERCDNLYKTNKTAFNNVDLLELKINSLNYLNIEPHEKEYITNIFKINFYAKDCLSFGYRYQKDEFLISFSRYLNYRKTIFIDKTWRKYINNLPMVFYYFRWSLFIWKVITHYKLFQTRW